MTAAHHELDDDALLEAHRSGDPDAFGVLFTRHRDRLWAVALRTTGNPEDAADALQEAMISAFRRADGFRGDSLVTTWLHRIVVNACLDRLRRNKVRSAQPLPDDLDEYAARGAVLTAPDDAGDPERQAVLRDLRGTVLAALDRLPADQKVALVLVDLEGHSVEEASRMLGCPPGTVKSRCARGRTRLAGFLREAGVTGTTAVPAAGPGTIGPAGASHRGEPATLETAGDPPAGGPPRSPAATHQTQQTHEAQEGGART